MRYWRSLDDALHTEGPLVVRRPRSTRVRLRRDGGDGLTGSRGRSDWKNARDMRGQSRPRGRHGARSRLLWFVLVLANGGLLAGVSGSVSPGLYHSTVMAICVLSIDSSLGCPPDSQPHPGWQARFRSHGGMRQGRADLTTLGDRGGRGLSRV